MVNKRIEIDRLCLMVTERCTLRCKMCTTHVPTLHALNIARDYDIAQIRKSLQTLFELTDHVRCVSVTGGEPILYSQLAELIEYLFQHEAWFSQLDVITNGTLAVSEPVLRAMAKSEKARFIVDHYGPELSGKVDEIAEQCKTFHVRYDIRKYYGEDAYCGGWVDMGTLPKRLSDGEAREHYQKCMNAGAERKACAIFGSVFAFCTQPYLRWRMGEIPREDALWIDMADDHITPEEKYRQLVELCNAPFNPGCFWCGGLDVDKNAERFVPAKQV